MKSAHELIPTRQSLLSRLKDWSDQESWRFFFETYWRLIYSTALKAGLTDVEAQEVVQETIISVSKRMPTFDYDPTQGSFKGWLLRLTKWRIADQLRQRQHDLQRRGPQRQRSSKTATVELVPDPAGSGLEAAWDEEWEMNLMEAAIERTKRRVDPKLYQVFDLYVLKQWSVSRVARALQINPGRVYLAKHRISNMIKKEIAYLRAKPI